MKPTFHLRFVERVEIVDANPEHGVSTGRLVKVLQQFYENEYGKDSVGDMLHQSYGSWLDVPLEKMR